MTEEQYAEHSLSRRERQIMGVIYRLGSATVNDIVDELPDPPTAGSARAMLNILVKKGLLRSEEAGPRKIYSPVVAQEHAAKSVLENVIETFFVGSDQRLVMALLDARRDKLSDKDLRKLADAIRKARERECE